jgi:hypothetical protein
MIDLDAMRDRENFAKAVENEVMADIEKANAATRTCNCAKFAELSYKIGQNIGALDTMAGNVFDQQTDEDDYEHVRHDIKRGKLETEFKKTLAQFKKAKCGK